MTRHSFKTPASESQAKQLFSYSINKIRNDGVGTANLSDEVYLQVMNDRPAFLPDLQSIENAFSGKRNRYCTVGTAARRAMVRAAWNNMAIAELRDLNRHRSGHRFSPLCPCGFYLPAEVSCHPQVKGLLDDYKVLIESMVASCDASPCDTSPCGASSQENGDDGAYTYVYALLLGTQVPFEHSTHLDKFIYEIELRTGMGAHFRYAEHLAKASAILVQKMPELEPFIQIGNAEPEF
jgi:hypothetical protein